MLLLKKAALKDRENVSPMRITQLLTGIFMAMLHSTGSGVTWTLQDCSAANTRQDYVEVLKLCRPLAEQGIAQAQTYLGVMYDWGLGVPQDDAEAVTWYRKAADQGEVDAQTDLGFMYERGQGVPQDNSVAHMWFSLAASHGCGPAGHARDQLATNMTLDQIAEAQRLEREWKPTMRASGQVDAPQPRPASPPTAPFASVAAPAGEDSVGIINFGKGAMVEMTLGTQSVVMLIDTGATVMLVLDRVANKMLASGEADVQGVGPVTMADGRTMSAKVIVIHRVILGSHVLTDVSATVVPGDADAIGLLPFSLLNRLKRFTIDTNRNKLIFG